jgi:hypothetical protein
MSTASFQFEALVRRILEANDFSIREPRETIEDPGFDFIGQSLQELWAIEVKYYRTVRPQVALLEAAATRLASRAVKYQAKKAMLVVSSLVPEDLRLRFEDKFSLTLIDRTRLIAWAISLPDLLDELTALLIPDASELLQAAVSRSHVNIIRTRYLSHDARAEDDRGTRLCSELRGLKSGKKSWPEYERICENILKYLFPNDLHGWHKQVSTTDGLNRFDYVCRIIPTTEFWQFIVQHLDSRYMIFEFKNYSEKIKQGQVLTTEKYLLERGLRRVAVVFSRNGADPNAVRMAQGAMREQGKLILVLKDDDVCKMLHMKEKGEDASDFLFELADNFLLALGR